MFSIFYSLTTIDVMKEIISLTNIKGGSCKTTNAIHLALALRNHGKVLAIDLDCQGDLTEFFFPDSDPEFFDKGNAYSLLRGDTTLDTSIYEMHNLKVLPAILELAELSYKGANLGFIRRLKNALDDSNFDYVVIDTPGSLASELTMSLIASTKVIIPVTPIPWSIRAVGMVFKEIENVQQAGLFRANNTFILPSAFGSSKRDMRLLERFKAMPEIELLPSIPLNDSVKKRTQASSLLQEDTDGFQAFLNLAEAIK